MLSLEELQQLNPSVRIQTITDESFRAFGEVHRIDCGAYEQIMKERVVPQEGNVYVALDQELQSEPMTAYIQDYVYGGLDIQVGYCNGTTNKVNAVEFHHGSEVAIACTDLVLFLGDRRDIQEKSIDTSQLQAFFVPKGSVVELYGTTLHFAPLRITDEGFKCVIILPKGTNEAVESADFPYVFARNKWLLIHEEHQKLKDRGALVGVTGENMELVSVKGC